MVECSACHHDTVADGVCRDCGKKQCKYCGSTNLITKDGEVICVECHAPQDSAESAVPPTDPDDGDADAPEQPRPRSLTGLKYALLVLGVLVLAAAAAGIGWVLAGDPADVGAGSSAAMPTHWYGQPPGHVTRL